MSRITAEQNTLGTFDYNYVDNTSGSSKGNYRLSSIDYPNGQVTNFSYYNNAGDQRLQQISNLNPTPASISQFDYAYNPAGEITQWQKQQNGTNFYQNLSYDLAGQLVSSLTGSGKSGPPYADQTAYNYDLASNRTAIQNSSVQTATIGGTVTTSDVLTITVVDPSLSGGSKAVNYTVQGGDTLADIAANLSANISKDSDLQTLGVNAVANSTLVSIRSVSPNITTYTKSLSGGATETITLGGVLNGSTNIEVGGTKTTSDVLTVTVTDAGLSGGSKTINYTVQAGDNLTSIATGIATAINGDTDLQSINVSATSASTVVNIKSLSTNATTYSTSVSGGATETLTATANNNGKQTAVIGGSKTTSDVLTVKVFDAGLTGSTPAGEETINYTVLGGDSLSSIATAIASAINGNSNLAAIGITATAVDTVVNINSNSTHITSYSSSLSGGATETITLGTSIGISKSTYNNLNELTAIAPGGKAFFEGMTNKAVKSVTIGGDAAYLNWSESFQGSTLLNNGDNSIDVVGIDGGNNSKTNTYKLSAKGAASSALTYDANGNLTDDDTNTYEWDAENRLIKINYPGTNNYTTFTYDPLGRCAKIVETTAGSTTSTKQFIWCGTKRCEERDGSNSLVSQYFPLGQTISGDEYYYTKDHLGNIRELTDDTGAIEAQYAYDPYGRATKLQGTMDSDFQYAGYYIHQRSGLNLTLFRAYNPETGRWLNRDPIGEDGTANLYQYVYNRPTIWFDNDGLAPDANYLTNPIENLFYSGITGGKDNFTIVIHGGKLGFKTDTQGSKRFSGKELAEDVKKNHPEYEDKDAIELRACEAGKYKGSSGLTHAGEFAKAIGKDTIAPIDALSSNGKVYTDSNGNNRLDNGEYVYPGNSGLRRFSGKTGMPY